MGKCGRYSTLAAAALFAPQRLSGTETLHLCRWDSILVVPEKGCNPPITVTLSGYSSNYDGTPRLTVGNQSADGFSITYAYDHRGRMVRKDVALASNPSFSILHSTFVWDGWNIIRETTTEPPAFQLSNLQTFKPSTDYVWGLDINGTLQGAGGVGGLLSVVRDDGTYLPTYDANGNISEYVDAADGTIAAHYDYSPFGEILMQDGDLAGTFTHRFSTKPYCSITKLVEYQLRKYRPEIGRWMSRDPIGEIGGMHILSYCNNNCIDLFDITGLDYGGNDLSVGSLTEMLVAGLKKVDALHISYDSKAYKKMLSEIKDRVKKDILEKLKETKCCSSANEVENTLGPYAYGGKLFTMSLLVSVVGRNPLPIMLDPSFGPTHYNFYTIGNNGSKVKYKGIAAKEPIFKGILCGYYFDVRINANIRDRFDFIPDRQGHAWKSKFYNIAATLWSSIYNEFLGASRPTVDLDIDERYEDTGVY